MFNSIFQITRESKYSFTFEKQASGFVGLDKNNAYFLITNVSKLVDVIQSLVKSFKKTDNTNNNTNNKNTIIYAHSRLDKTMFGSLRNVLKNEWLNNTNNYVIKISTEV